MKKLTKEQIEQQMSDLMKIYSEQRDQAWAVCEAKRAEVYAEYQAIDNGLWAEYEAACEALEAQAGAD